MFNVGDMVRNVAANIVGVVVETDGDTVYFEQSNGCEVDFSASDLVLESEFQAKHDTVIQDDVGSHKNEAIYNDVLSNVYPAIINLGQARYAQAKRVSGVTPKSWDTLSALQKLNAISEATDVPVKVWIESNRPGAEVPLGKLQLAVLAAKA